MLQRVLGGLFIRAMETGDPLIGTQTEVAAAYFELATLARTDWAWPHLQLARCHAILGDEKAALRDLTQAVEKGATAKQLTDLTSSAPQMKVLSQSDAFLKLLAATAAR